MPKKVKTRPEKYFLHADCDGCGKTMRGNRTGLCSKCKRTQNTEDLLTLLGVLYANGPRTIEALTEALDAPNRVSDARVNGLVERIAYLNEWLGLS
jgi:hypothetical protein